MTVATAPPRFRQGAGRLCLDFVRTLRRRGTPDVTEELADPAALAAWVRQCGPALVGTAPAAPPSAAAVRDAQALREAVHALITGLLPHGGPVPPDAGARARLNRAAAEPAPVPQLTAQGDVRWQAADPVAATLSLIARDALDLAASPALLARLHPCACPKCGALFLDNSRPGTRRWCSMDICGNRAKKSALRTRVDA